MSQQRAAKSSKTSVDLTQAVNFDEFTLKENDCFGRLWDPRENDCAVCADCQLCGIVFNEKTVKAKRKQLEAEKGPFLDQVKPLSNEAANNLNNSILGMITDGDSISINDLYDAVKKLTKSKDKVFIERESQAFLDAHGFVIENGILTHKI